MEYFEKAGIKTKTERGGRVFPVSDKASDIRDALYNDALNNKVKFIFNEKVNGILTDNQIATGVYTKENKYLAENIILACGGATYPLTGSDGSGYRIAQSIGHTIIPIKGSLTGLITKEKWPVEMAGLTLKNVRFLLYRGEKKLYEEMGELLFTHKGISGPVVLTGSRHLIDKGYDQVSGIIDLKPALSFEKLDARIPRDFNESLRKQFKNSLEDLLPKKLIPVVISLSEIDPEKQVNQITKTEREKIAYTLKNLKVNIRGPEPINEAIVTSGGVSVKEIDPKTMESKLIKNLFFAGEMMDVDAFTGGYNLTIAFSTGYLAGKSVRV